MSQAPRFPLEVGDRIMGEVVGAIGAYVTRWDAVGSIRRRCPEIGDVDLLVEVRHPIPLNVARIRSAMKRMGKWIRGADRMMVIERDGLHVDVFLCHPPTNYNALLALRTGPASDTQALTSALEAKGLKRPHAQLRCNSEQHLYTMAGLPWVPPGDRR